jgi:uncharacterized protein (DUF1684 family)
MGQSSEQTLWDYRRRVVDLYHEVRRTRPGEEAWTTWRAGRDQLLREHAQSPLDVTERGRFNGLPYFTYDPAWRFEAVLQPLEDFPSVALRHSVPGETAFHPFGHADLGISRHRIRITFYWLEGYGGGVFVPFGDRTNESETYGGGRYLLDSVKGADLGSRDGKVILDFNYAYHPSCVYSNRWSCPLAPAEKVAKRSELRTPRKSSPLVSSK